MLLSSEWRDLAGLFLFPFRSPCDSLTTSLKCLTSIFFAALFLTTTAVGQNIASENPVLPGTTAWTGSGDTASNLVMGVDRFLSRKWNDAFAIRRDLPVGVSNPTVAETNRLRFRHLIGVRDLRVLGAGPSFSTPLGRNGAVARLGAVDVFEVTWPVLKGVGASGLVLIARDRPRKANVVVLPDADQTPEHFCGLLAGAKGSSTYPWLLAEAGCRVFIPTLVNREAAPRRSPHGGGGAVLTAREFVYRPAFELGRHVIGYEVQEILALVDWFQKADGGLPVGVIGWGEGGLLALYAAAADDRIDAACVSGYVGNSRDVWREPIDRNVFGLLPDFSDPGLIALIAPRTLIVEAARGPELQLSGKGGAPGILKTPSLDLVQADVEEGRRRAGTNASSSVHLTVSGPNGAGEFATEKTRQLFLQALKIENGSITRASIDPIQLQPALLQDRSARKVAELHRHTQEMLEESSFVRKDFVRSWHASPSQYESNAVAYRKFFYDEVIGRFNDPLLPLRVESRKIYDEPKWVGYEVAMDVFPDVMASGILLVPKDLKPGERRPVVVCQHGLEGRSQDVIRGNHPAYHDFAAKLAERGFITFAPQNLYIFQDAFRLLQRKANPLGKTLFSIITPQHEQILKWLKTLSFVDGSRIGFYGLSYGGKTAMRVPALLTDYCLSICSADFNDWVWKNASTTSPYSYVWTGEYEIFEFDLGSNFNYSEMAALIAPRPFMVERGHFDNVAPDDRVAYEFARVRFLYEGILKLPSERCVIEWFDGPHTIHGQGTFAFLHRHLNWPPPTQP